MLIHITGLIEGIHIHVRGSARGQNPGTILLDHFLALLRVDFVYSSRALQLYKLILNYAIISIISISRISTHLQATLNEVMHRHHEIDLQNCRLQVLGQMPLNVVDAEVIGWHLNVVDPPGEIRSRLRVIR